MGIQNLMSVTCSKRKIIEVWMDFFFLFSEILLSIPESWVVQDYKSSKTERITILINKTGQA